MDINTKNLKKDCIRLYYKTFKNENRFVIFDDDNTIYLKKQTELGMALFAIVGVRFQDNGDCELLEANPLGTLYMVNPTKYEESEYEIYRLIYIVLERMHENQNEVIPDRYEVYLYPCDKHGTAIESESKHFTTNDLKFALHEAAVFYIKGEYCPIVNIFDNELGDYIVEWD